MLQMEEVKQIGEGLKSHSASVAKLKNELKIFNLVSLHSVHSHNMFVKECCNIKVLSKLKHNLLGIIGYA